MTTFILSWNFSLIFSIIPQGQTKQRRLNYIAYSSTLGTSRRITAAWPQWNAADEFSEFFSPVQQVRRTQHGPAMFQLYGPRCAVKTHPDVAPFGLNKPWKRVCKHYFCLLTCVPGRAVNYGQPETTGRVMRWRQEEEAENGGKEEGGRGRGRRKGGRMQWVHCRLGCAEQDGETLLPTKPARNVSSCKIKVRGRRDVRKYN